MSDAPELIPCPTCGGEARYSTKSGITGRAVKHRWFTATAHCKKGSCGTTTKMCKGSQAKAKAGKLWNTRADISATDKQIAARLHACVKPLEWEEPCKANNWIYVARSPWGDYGIHIDGGRHRAWLEAHVKPYERWLGDDDVRSVYEAQAAAQAHYAEQIMAALDLSAFTTEKETP